MIRLEVEEYCSQCPEFEPDIERREEVVGCVDFSEPSGYRAVRFCDTVIRCKHAARCEGIRSYLKTKE